jgi:hypothetical protein
MNTPDLLALILRGFAAQLPLIIVVVCGGALILARRKSLFAATAPAVIGSLVILLYSIASPLAYAAIPHFLRNTPVQEWAVVYMVVGLAHSAILATGLGLIYFSLVRGRAA